GGVGGRARGAAGGGGGVGGGAEGPPIESRERGALARVGHHDEVPPLGVRSGGRLEGDLDRALEEGGLDGAGQVETLADGTGGGEQLVDHAKIHGVTSWAD